MKSKLVAAIALGVFVVGSSAAYAGVDPGDLCKEKKLKAAGKKALDLLKAFGKNIKKEEWACDCPVCRENLDRVLNPTTDRTADIRAVHNLLILKRAAHDPKLRECVLFAKKYYKKTPACSSCKRVRHIGDCAMKKYRGQCLVQKNTLM